MSTSDSPDEDELVADSGRRAFSSGKTMSSHVVQLTSTLKVVYSSYSWTYLLACLSYFGR